MNQRDELRLMDVSPSLAVSGGRPGQGLPLVIHEIEEPKHIVRKLTPLECERLMGWPDQYTAQGVDDNNTVVDISNTQRYRMCGNGIVTNVTRWIGGRLPDV